MNEFRNFDQVKTAELFVKRHKWFFPYFELTDGQFVYGKLSYKNNYKRYAIIETADGFWTIKMKGLLKRNLLINKGDDETIGTLIPATWKRDILLEMENGFKATYLYKKFFARSLTLSHDMYGDIINLKQEWWSFSKPFTVTYDPSVKTNDMPPIPLLALIGLHLTLIRQAQAAS
ncbi:hypothetical protein [Mucilaginibacter glaciei]|uniref:Uncharacterized protein n=1 Tax=Mucilaginibacter glaciei TaxID=2772109 RepID=A0A926NTH8_9SPHI|nr:hypothetical protein [Mucilaginibacter glaciei]MBD1394727.1 hypothetical protein [Mucilaginibacter glaciei]